MSRDRAYSTASSGNGSEDYPYANNAPRQKNKNGRHTGGNGSGGHNNDGGGQHRYHEMTLLCHRVDLFDDFVAGAERPGDISVIEDGDSPVAATPSVQAPADVHPNLAFLFAGNAGAAGKKTPSSEIKGQEAITKTTVSSTLVVDQIFAHNHGLLSDNVEGGVKVKKYHHPPVGRYTFSPPMMELPRFFDEKAQVTPTSEKAGPKKNGHSEYNGESKEEQSVSLDSFFDDFAVPPKPAAKEHTNTKQIKDNDGKILVFRAPLKTVVKKTCQSRYDNLVKGSTQQNPHDSSVVHDKYWAQRRRLFRRFDEGIQLDAEGWYSVTPEAVADHVASRFAEALNQLVLCPNTNARGGRVGQKQKPKATVILDAFCGCGGNAIAFAKLPASVVSLIVCVDVDRSKLRMAAHNASIYCIPPNRIIFVEANSVAVLERCYRDGKLIMDPPPRTPQALAAYPPREVYGDFTIGGIDMLAEYAQHIDAVFMDPPWGGIDYGAMGKDGYDLARDMKIRGCERGCVGFPPTAEIDGVRLLKIAAAATSTKFVAYDLPRNANKRSLAWAALEAGYEGNSKLEEHYLNGRLKTVTGYFGQDFRHLLDLGKYHGTHRVI